MRSGSWRRCSGRYVGMVTTSSLYALRNSRAEQSEDEIKKRSNTLTSVLTTALQMVIIAVFAFMILSEIGLDIAPILAGVGVVGIAIGFGAQSLVKDIIAGLFIIMENQYRKGDVVKIADVSGSVWNTVSLLQALQAPLSS